MKTAIIWFTNDLRVDDHPGLAAATQQNDQVIAYYCFDPADYAVTTWGFRKTGDFRARFIAESLEELARGLSALGIELCYHQGDTAEGLAQLAEKHQAHRIYTQNHWMPEERARIERCQQWCSAAWVFHHNSLLIDPEDLGMNLEDLPWIFTEFRKKIERNLRIRPAVQARKMSDSCPPIHPIPELTSWNIQTVSPPSHTAFPFRGGGASGLERLHHYTFGTQKVAWYKHTRNGMLGVDYSTKFSPYLALGCLSARTIYRTIKDFEQQHVKNEDTYWVIFELLWREFFAYTAMKYGAQFFSGFGIAKQLSPEVPHWKKNPSVNPWQQKKSIPSNGPWGRWVNGQTASDFVNAHMVELAQTGWMSNRGRQNVASYLVHELGVDWRWGAAYFESLLLDYDPSSNYGNWMYVAGVGNDPRARVFNMERQAQQYDPKGVHQKTWLQTALF